MNRDFLHTNYCDEIKKETKIKGFLKNINSKSMDEIIDFINEIGYRKLSEKRRESFVNHVIQRGKANEIYEFMYKVIEPLHIHTLDEANALAHAMLKTKDTEYIEKFAFDCRHIHINCFINFANYLVETKGNIGKLLDVVKGWSMDLIDNFVSEIIHLTEHEIDEILSVIIITKGLRQKHISNFVVSVKNLTYKNITDSLNGLISDTTPANYIEFLAIIKSRDNDTLLKLEKFIMETKDLHLIASYLFVTLDVELINKIFGNIQAFLRYLRLEKSYLYLSDEAIGLTESELVFAYVDSNIDKYIREKESKLVKSDN